MGGGATGVIAPRKKAKNIFELKLENKSGDRKLNSARVGRLC